MSRFYKFKNGKLLDITSIISIDTFEKLEKVADKYEKWYYISIIYVNYKITLLDYYGTSTNNEGLLWSRLNHNDLDNSLRDRKSLRCNNSKTINEIETRVNNMNIKFINENELKTELIKLEEYIKIYYNEL